MNKLSETLALKNDTLDQFELLIQELSRMVNGQLEHPIKVADYSGSYRKMANGLESMRKLMLNTESDLQVTGAQLESVHDPLQEAVGWAERMANSLAELIGGLAEVEALLQNMRNTISYGEKSLTSANLTFQEAAQTSENLSHVSTETTEKLKALQTAVGGMDSVLSQINQISSQVKLISFNVAIEAARAGDIGQGFNVIAQEMKKLADQSSTGIKETSKVTNRVKQELSILIVDVGSRQQDINKGLVEALAEARNSFSILQQDIQDIFNNFSQLEERVRYYLQEMNQQLMLWKKAAQSLRSTSEFLEEVEQSLASALNRRRRNTSVYEINHQLVDQILSQLSSLAGCKQIPNLNETDHQKVLTEFLSANSEIEAVYSNRSDGSFIFSMPAAALVNARARPWWIEAMKGNRYCSEVYISAITRHPCLTLAVPILGTDGKPVGVLAADLLIG